MQAQPTLALKPAQRKTGKHRALGDEWETVVAQRIWLIRHGKSSRPFGMVDHERPLSERATGDAALIRKWLGERPRLFVTSTARRARATAELIAGERPVTTHEELYHATPTEFLRVVEEVMENTDSAAFVAHNPAITDLVNALAGRAVTDNVSTLGVAVFERKPGGTNPPWKLVDYVAPKQLRR